MDEAEQAFILANRVLDKPYIDPDGDICLLARQYLRSRERIADLMAELDHLRNTPAARFTRMSANPNSE